MACKRHYASESSSVALGRGKRYLSIESMFKKLKISHENAVSEMTQEMEIEIIATTTTTTTTTATTFPRFELPVVSGRQGDVTIFGKPYHINKLSWNCK